MPKIAPVTAVKHYMSIKWLKSEDAIKIMLELGFIRFSPKINNKIRLRILERLEEAVDWEYDEIFKRK